MLILFVIGAIFFSFWLVQVMRALRSQAGMQAGRLHGLEGAITTRFFGNNDADEDHVHYTHGNTQFIADVLGAPVTDVAAALDRLRRQNRIHIEHNAYGYPVWHFGPRRQLVQLIWIKPADIPTTQA